MRTSEQYPIGSEFQSHVNDAVTAYVTKKQNSFTNYGKEPSINAFQDPLLKHFLIQHGLAFHLFETFRKPIPFDDDQWAELLHISRRTLERHRESKKAFKPLQSDRILEVIDVVRHGLSVFNDKEKFYRWLFTPSVPLGNISPFELMKNSYGKELVMDELYRIDYGIFA